MTPFSFIAILAGLALASGVHWPPDEPYIRGLTQAKWIGLEPWLRSLGLIGARATRELQEKYDFTRGRRLEQMHWPGLNHSDKLELLYYRQSVTMWTAITMMDNVRLYNLTYIQAAEKCPTHLHDFISLRELGRNCK